MQAGSRGSQWDLDRDLKLDAPTILHFDLQTIVSCNVKHGYLRYPAEIQSLFHNGTTQMATNGSLRLADSRPSFAVRIKTQFGTHRDSSFCCCQSILRLQLGMNVVDHCCYKVMAYLKKFHLLTIDIDISKSDQFRDLNNNCVLV